MSQHQVQHPKFALLAKALVFPLVIAGSLAATAVAAPPSTAHASGHAGDLTGRWAPPGRGSIIEFGPCRDASSPAATCGRMVKLGNDSNLEERDRHNPDPANRDRRVLGLEMVRDIRAAGPGAWTVGELYNPDDGHSYTGTIRLRGEILELKGCALKVFCRTQTWRKAPEAAPADHNG